MNYKSKMNELINETSKGFLGKNKIVEDAILSILSGLHILIEDISGVGKTTLVKSLSKACGLSMNRIQFTPDLLPGDITGMSIWDPVKREFILKKGSIFNQFILGDEINRASPRTQSALLEAMEENTVTIDGKSFKLPEPFTVIATKNPSFYIGTFELPESQLDRFGVFIQPGYPKINDEISILEKFKNKKPVDSVKSITSPEIIIEIINKIQSIEIPNEVMKYIVEIGNKTRNNPDIKYGVSTRGLQHLIKLAQAKALYMERDFIIPEDILYSAPKVLSHKIILSPEAIMNNKSSIEILNKILADIKVPIGIK